MNASHFNQILSERIGTFRNLSENALYPEVKEWADDCIDILEQVKKDFQMCQEEPESDEEELMRKFYVGAKCHYVGETHKELCGLVGHIHAVFKWEVLVEFEVEDTDELWPVYRLPKDDVIPF